MLVDDSSEVDLKSILFCTCCQAQRQLVAQVRLFCLSSADSHRKCSSHDFVLKCMLQYRYHLDLHPPPHHHHHERSRHHHPHHHHYLPECQEDLVGSIEVVQGEARRCELEARLEPPATTQLYKAAWRWITWICCIVFVTGIGLLWNCTIISWIYIICG